MLSPLISTRHDRVPVLFKRSIKKLFSLIALCAVTSFCFPQAGSYGAGSTGLNRLGPYNGLTGSALDKGMLDEDFTIRLERTVDFDKKYFYPSFVVGKVIIKGKPAGGLKVNYHRLFGELVFINVKGDTLIINDNPAIEFIQTTQHLFYHHKKEGFFTMLAPQDNHVWLLSREVLKIAKTESISQNTANAARTNVARDTTTYHAIYHHRDRSKLLLDVTFKEQKFYFLCDKDGELSKANKNSFLRVFSKDKQVLKNWIEQENIDFDLEGDLVKLYEHCLGLN